MQTNKDSWNKQAQRYFQAANYPLDDVVYFDNVFPTEKDLKIIGDVRGLKILELGSGFCNCGIALAKQGAEVSCLDLSEEQLEIGRELVTKEQVEIKTVVGDFLDLSQFEKDSFDLVGSFAALQYCRDIDQIFLEIHRVLKPGGRIIFSTDHMATISALENLPYNYRQEYRWKWQENDAFDFSSFPLPPSDYLNSLIKAGFTVDRVEELLPKAGVENGWSEEEKKIRFLLPTVLVVSARK